MRRILADLSLLLLAMGLLACGPAGDDDDASDDDDAVDVCADYETEGEWEDLDEDQRRLFMECEVVPEMRDLFQEFDADEYSNFSCDTCHGADREEVDHEMPNGLEELPMGGFPFSQSDDPEEAAYGEFMEQEVLGAMQDLLVRSSDFQDPEFFGCYGCHE